jgi:phosphopentomutase
MSRAVLCVLDSLGIGHSADADRFGDIGADTLGHIAEHCARGLADKEGVRSGPLKLPNLYRWGLAAAASASSGQALAHAPEAQKIDGVWGFAVEQSRGKDTPSGHWEMAGVPMETDWGYFPRQTPAFPASLTDALIKQAKLPGILGNIHASGTEILEALGEAHLSTGKPICYTSADSVFQIAAHEDSFGLERLYALSEIAFELLEPYNIGRVIARPFTGTSSADFRRTGNRRDFTIKPPAPTLLDALLADAGEVISVGKIKDIFAGNGISKTIKADGNMALFDATLAALKNAGNHSLVFTNFVDFDMLYGHRRDVVGYAAALEAFDARLPELERLLEPGDIVILSADHGCDPTWPGTDHTREHVPVLAFGPGLAPRSIGQRDSFADIGASLRRWFDLAPGQHGKSWI